MCRYGTIPRSIVRRALVAVLAILVAAGLPLSQAAAAPTSVLSTVANWTTTGGATNNYFGYSVANAGDVNGDGYADVIVGAYGAGSNGRVYLYLGSASGLSTTAATTITGAGNNDQFGFSVASAGDVNKDGRADIIVGAPGTGNSVGTAYLYLGTSTGLNTTSAWSVSGSANSSYFGSSVASAGDVNKDGYPDVIVGAYGSGSSGRAYVYQGTSTGLSTTAAWNVAGPVNGEQFGFAVASAGDVNKDGYGDVIVGAPSNDSSGTDRGRAYVFLGGSGGLSTTAAATRTGEANSNFFGYSVAGAGDVNGDGNSDVIIGAYGNGTSNTGKAYVYLGTGNSNAIGTTAAWTAVGEATNNYFGYSVAGAGDVNKDGYADIIVGAYGNGSNAGKAYVYLGSSTGPATTQAWSATGDAGSQFGKSVSSAGDVNGDTYADVVVGGPSLTTNTGKAYAFYTDYVAPTVNIDTKPANPTNSTSASFAFTVADNTGGSGIASRTCKLDSGTATACTTSASYPGPLSAGSHTFTLTATDYTGNVTTATYTWIIDTTPPSVTINQASGQTDPTSSLPIVFTAVFNEAVTGFTGTSVTLGGTANVGSATIVVAATADPNTYSISVSGVTGNGTVTASIAANKVTDAAGNGNTASTSTDNSVTYYSDTTAPTVTITGKPNDPSKSNSASFTFSATDETGGSGLASSPYLCKLDAGPYSPCTSPQDYLGTLTDGSHTFSVTATDKAGNTSSADTYTWVVDTVAPSAPTISGQPADPTNSTSANFSFVATDNTGGSGLASSPYSCKLDNAAYGSCTSPQAYPSLAAGSHTFRVTATDKAGNTSAEATYTWVIDTAAPSVTVNQASGQLDPTTSLPILFTAVFNKPVSGFTDADITLTGTADRSAATIVVSGGPSSYSISIGGITGNGTVIASVPAGGATDSAGNGNTASTSTDNSVTYYSDTTAPTVTIDSSPAQFSNSNSGSFTFSATDETGGSGVASYACKLDSGSYSPCTSAHPVGPLLDGSHTFYVTATDFAGNTSAAATYTWVIDTVAPVASIDTKPSSLSNSNSASFGFSATDTGGSGVASYTCTLDTGTPATCTSPHPLSALADGSHTFYVTATDKAGNTSAAASYSWVVDTTAPVVTITSKPGDPSNNGAPQIAFSATDGSGSGVASYECSLDGGSPAACTSPRSLGSLGDGSHIFSVTATDAAGNPSAPASYTWVVDTTAPSVTIDSKPGAFSNNSSPTFAFSATDGTGSGIASYACTVDGSTAACTSPLTLGPLGDGSHSFSVTATDKAGNTSAAASYSWVVDTVAPVVNITTGPANFTNSTSASFSFAATETGSGVTAYTCTLDGGTPAACTSGIDYAGLAAGSHTFSVTATDAAGNTSAPANYSWVVDTTAPVVSIDTKPANPTNSTSASLGFSATDAGGTGVASYTCTVDGGAPATCTSPVVLSSLAEGSHTFSVTATDKAGNTSTAATYAWAVDITAPVVSIDTKPSSPTNSTTANFTFSATDTGSGVASYSCAVDGGAAGACTSPVTLNSLAQGSHTFSVTATDNAGNTSAAATYTWIVNTTAPSVSITGKPGNPTNSKNADFTFTGTDAGGSPISSFTCTLDSGTPAACPGSASYTSLADGSHTFSVTATDGAGNTSTATYTWVVDTLPPATPVVSGPANPTNSKSANLTFSATDTGGSGVASYTCTVDGGAPATCTSPQTLNNLTDGTHTFSVIATDAAGNSSTAATFTWVVDTVAPVASIDTKPGNPSKSNSASFTFSAMDGTGSGVDTFKCSLDGSTATACTSPHPLTGLADGSHLFSVIATDKAGNSSAAATYTWVVDTTPPVVSITAHPANPTNSTGATFNFEATDTGGTGVATYTCTLDTGAATACTSPLSFTGLAAGAHIFSVTATDNAGNTSTAATYSWTIDTTAPSVTVNQAAGQADPTSSLPILFTAAFNKPVTGFTNGDVTLSGTATLGSATIAVTGGPSSYTISVGGVSGNGTVIVSIAANIATDAAGNGNTAATSTDNTVTYYTDTIPPAVGFDSGPGPFSNNPTPTFKFTGTDTGGSGIAAYTCKLDNGAPFACTSPATVGPLGAGSHTFTVTATDHAGNNSTPVTYAWVIDTTAPAVTVNQAAGQADPTASLPIVFTAVFNEPVSGFTKADVTLSGTAGLGSATITVTGGPSTYTISVDGVSSNGTVIATIAANAAVDGAGNGNTASTSTDNTVTFNTSAPPPPAVSGPAEFSNSASPTFVFTGTAGTTFTCSLNEAPPTPCTSPVTLGALPDGNHTFAVTAADGAGNSSAPTTYKWSVDTTPPVAAASALPQPNAVGWNNTDVTVSFTGTDGGSGITSCTAAVVVSTEGVHANLSGTCTDKAGNTSQPAVVASVKLDKTAPTNVSGAPASSPTGAGGWYEAPVLIVFTGSDALSGIASCSTVTYSGPFNPNATVAGTCTDKAGNTSALVISEPFAYGTAGHDLYLPQIRRSK